MSRIPDVVDRGIPNDHQPAMLNTAQVGFRDGEVWEWGCTNNRDVRNSNAQRPPKNETKGLSKEFANSQPGVAPDFPVFPGTRAPPSLRLLSKLPLNLAQDQPAVPGPKKSSRIVREVLPMAQLLPSAKQ